MQLHGEARALVRLELRYGMRHLLAVELASAAVDELLEDAVPDVDADQRGEEYGDHDKQPHRRPPGRTRNHPEVRRRADDRGQVPDAREDVVRVPAVDLE